MLSCFSEFVKRSRSINFESVVSPLLRVNATKFFPKNIFLVLILESLVLFNTKLFLIYTLEETVTSQLVTGMTPRQHPHNKGNARNSGQVQAQSMNVTKITSVGKDGTLRAMKPPGEDTGGQGQHPTQDNAG